MGEKTVNWLIYTCLLALIPAIARGFVWMLSTDGIEPVAVSDMVAFGLVLHSANINEVNRIPHQTQNWKTVHNGVSILFLVVYALLLFITMANPNNLNALSILRSAIILSIVSFLLSFSVFTALRSERDEA